MKISAYVCTLQSIATKLIQMVTLNNFSVNKHAPILLCTNNVIIQYPHHVRASEVGIVYAYTHESVSISMHISMQYQCMMSMCVIMYACTCASIHIHV